jgi:hypothetical protein
VGSGTPRANPADTSCGEGRPSRNLGNVASQTPRWRLAAVDLNYVDHVSSNGQSQIQPIGEPPVAALLSLPKILLEQSEDLDRTNQNTMFVDPEVRGPIFLFVPNVFMPQRQQLIDEQFAECTLMLSVFLTADPDGQSPIAIGEPDVPAVNRLPIVDCLWASHFRVPMDFRFRTPKSTDSWLGWRKEQDASSCHQAQLNDTCFVRLEVVNLEPVEMKLTNHSSRRRMGKEADLLVTPDDCADYGLAFSSPGWSRSGKLGLSASAIGLGSGQPTWSRTLLCSSSLGYPLSSAVGGCMSWSLDHCPEGRERPA